MKKLLTFLVVLLLLQLVMPLATAVYVQPGSPGSIPTAADVSAGSGSAPIIHYAWVLEDDDSSKVGTQVNIVPSDYTNDVYACIVVSDAQGRDTISDVYTDVYHPDYSYKYQKHATKITVRSEVELCKSKAVAAGLITQTQANEIDYWIFSQNEWYMYKVALPMYYHQPAGEYGVIARSVDMAGEISAPFNTEFEWVAATYLELDFTTLNFGIIQPGNNAEGTPIYAYIQGDETMGGTAPTVKNEGNTLIDIELNASTMRGNNYGKLIDDFDAQFLGDHINFVANQIATFADSLALCRTEKIDFSVHADFGTPADHYIGKMTIYAVPVLP